MFKHRKTILLRRLKATKKNFHRKRHPHRKHKHKWHPFAVLSLSVMLGTSVVVHESITKADILPPLDNFEIRTQGGTDIEVGQSIRLTAEGYYGTAPVAVKATWNLLGNQLGTLHGCTESQECTFVATKPGTAVIEAKAHEQFEHISIDIRGPVEPMENNFTDEVPQWAENPIVDLSRRNIIRGYDDGRFGSADSLTRGQLITLMYRMLTHLELVGRPQNCRQYYNDIRPEHFSYSATCLFWQRGWSTSLNRLGVDEKANRAETARILHQIFGAQLLNHWRMTLGDIYDNGMIFADVPVDHSVFYESAVLNRAGIMTGYSSGLFGPEETLNRAEAATLLHRALQKVKELDLGV